MSFESWCAIERATGMVKRARTEPEQSQNRARTEPEQSQNRARTEPEQTQKNGVRVDEVK
jgi:hypothetical protein